MTAIIEISEEEYKKSPAISRVIDDEKPRRFARLILSRTSAEVFMSWHSDLINPLVSSNREETLTWIGIDQRLVAVSSEGSIQFSIRLNSNILQLITLDVTVAVCELAIVIINSNFSIRRIVELQEIPDHVDVRDSTLVVEYIDGEKGSLEF
jgi:hypothetical protein